MVILTPHTHNPYSPLASDPMTDTMIPGIRPWPGKSNTDLAVLCCRAGTIQPMLQYNTSWNKIDTQQPNLVIFN